MIQSQFSGEGMQGEGAWSSLSLGKAVRLHQEGFGVFLDSVSLKKK